MLLDKCGADLSAKDHAGWIPDQRSDGSTSEKAMLIWWARITQLLEQKKIAKLDEMLDTAPPSYFIRDEYAPATPAASGRPNNSDRCARLPVGSSHELRYVWRTWAVPLHDEC